MRAYSELYLQNAQTNLAVMLDTGVREMGYTAEGVFRMFVVSGIADAFGTGDVRYLAGMSGVELAAEVAERCGMRTKRPAGLAAYGRSPEYWAGWAIAYYQWYRAISFPELLEAVSVNDVLAMYHPYHEMDILQFVDALDELIRAIACETKLAGRRIAAGLSQRELSLLAGVSVRTIQQYEQRQKDINRAAGETLRLLADALCCRMEQLMETA